MSQTSKRSVATKRPKPRPNSAKRTPMQNPYVSQPPSAFWNTAVSEFSPMEMDGVYEPRFEITKDMRISAAGSCFAQHIARQFRLRGYNFMDFEPAPSLVDEETADEFGYGHYSARYGNIYSVRQLIQLFARAYDRFTPADKVWENGGRFYDPFRPSIQKGGFATKAECLLERDHHLNCVKAMLEQTDVFVFTFGLTEAWENTTDRAVLPTCPGTIAGEFDPSVYAFKNFRFAEVLRDTKTFIRFAHEHNPDMKFLFTVSPVPLKATATDQHVLPATVYSKSVLRAVCGELMMEHNFVDYFPSYELVASHPMRGAFYRPDMRDVAAEGVARVMDIFFRAQGDAGIDQQTLSDAPKVAVAADVHCDEEILEMFSS
ncbi:MAG: GSCFA domain-containing protein [Pseudomonadota bacterium]